MGLEREGGRLAASTFLQYLFAAITIDQEFYEVLVAVLAKHISLATYPQCLSRRYFLLPPSSERWPTRSCPDLTREARRMLFWDR